MLVCFSPYLVLAYAAHHAAPVREIVPGFYVLPGLAYEMTRANPPRHIANLMPAVGVAP